MIEEAKLRRIEKLNKEKDYDDFISNVRQTFSESIIADISSSFLTEPRGVYENKSLHVIKPRSTQEVSEFLKENLTNLINFENSVNSYSRF